ncbi:hypothetical protein [Oleiharenicola sp. Vm1]|uniref:hypothetical protein n=1 Tax=Oleiharenicola sp. Vm1 TaxID=3398393 RepID=UPI0039F50DCE
MPQKPTNSNPEARGAGREQAIRQMARSPDDNFSPAYDELREDVPPAHTELEDDPNDILTHRVGWRLFDRGVNHSFLDADVMEFELDRENPAGAFPSRYAVLALRFRPETKTVDFSIEPMFKPEQGDAYSESYVSDADRENTRKRAADLLTQHIGPVVGRYGFTIGNEVGCAMEEDSEAVAEPLALNFHGRSDAAKSNDSEIQTTMSEQPEKTAKKNPPIYVEGDIAVFLKSVNSKTPGEAPTEMYNLAVGKGEDRQYTDAFKTLQNGVTLEPADVVRLLNGGTILVNVPKKSNPAETFELAVGAINTRKPNGFFTLDYVTGFPEYSKGENPQVAAFKIEERELREGESRDTKIPQVKFWRTVGPKSDPVHLELADCFRLREGEVLDDGKRTVRVEGIDETTRFKAPGSKDWATLEKGQQLPEGADVQVFKTARVNVAYKERRQDTGRRQEQQRNAPRAGRSI